MDIYTPNLREAYKKSTIQVPRYQRTGRPISSMTFAGNNCIISANYLPVIRYESLYFNPLEAEKTGENLLWNILFL